MKDDKERMRKKEAEKIIEENRKVYDIIAPNFSATRSYVWADLTPLAQYVKTGDRVLDIGCGNGRLLQLFKDKKISYAGIDQSMELVNIAREKFPDAEFAVADMRALPFPDASFDVIFCIAAFHHLPDEETRLHALREMRRVLKPRGTIVMTNWNFLSDWARKKYGEGKRGDYIVAWKGAHGNMLGERYYHAVTLDELKGLCRMAGLNEEEQYYAKKGERSDAAKGENIVTILKSP